MALTATIFNFDVQLSDIDRGVYESLSFKVAQHPSEATDYMLSRVLAYCLAYEEGIAFGKGIGDDEPPIYARDLSGQLKLWIEVGMPSAERLHRASKAAERVAIYTHRDPTMLLRNLEGERIHRAEFIPLFAFEKSFIHSLAASVERRTTMDLSVTERKLFVNIGGESLESELIVRSLV
jgi:uncharacterized protein YaeQ